MKEKSYKGIIGASKHDAAVAARWALIDERYAGQHGRYPLEISYPQTALSILRNMAGERKHKKRWEQVGGGHHKTVSLETRTALERRMQALVIKAMRELCNEALQKDK